MAKSTTHSSYWVDDNSLFDFETEDINKNELDVSDGVERIVKLATIRRAVANFVRILTNDSSIEVKFSSGQSSFTDGKTVIISADHTPNNFDPMVGLALHEGSHCLLTDFEFLRIINAGEATFYASIHPQLREMVKLHSVMVNDYDKMYENKEILRTLRRHIYTLINIIEDRRIDTYVYRAAPGYRPYYDAMYTKYFFNSDVEKNMQFNPDWRKPTVENYVNWLIHIFSPRFDKTALPGLDKMVKLIDLKNIRRFDEKRMPNIGNWKSTHTPVTPDQMSPLGSAMFNSYEYEQFPLLWRVANELMIEILKRVKFHAERKDEASAGGSGTGMPIEIEFNENDITEMENEGLPNYDLPQKRFNVKKAEKALEKMKEVQNQTARKKKIKKTEEQQIQSMESANAQMTEISDPVYGKIPCLVTRKLTKQIMVSDWFPFANKWDIFKKDSLAPHTSYSYRGFLAGIRMGQILTHKLQVRNEPQVTHFTRQEHGKIDRRILSQLGMDIENVFKRTTVDSYNPALLYLSVDASGSMWGGKWERVMTVMTALAFAADKIKNLDVIVSLRGNLSSGIPTVAVIYDSRADNFVKAKTLFPYLCSMGSTPEGLCYPSTLELMEECVKTHTVYFVNFSDGEPGCSFKHNGKGFDYGGSAAHKQTKSMVRQMRELGIRVMSYFISEYSYNSTGNSYTKQAFREMYGQDAEFVDVKNVVSVLKTLNKLLLVRE
jgi:hypothetical protein